MLNDLTQIRNELLVNGVLRYDDFRHMPITEMLEIYKSFKKKKLEDIMDSATSFMLSQSQQGLRSLERSINNFKL